MSHFDSLGEIAIPQSWVLPGVGQEGSDVEVISLDAYQKLAARCKNAEASALMWGRKCSELENGRASEFDPAALAIIARSLRLPVSAIWDALQEGDG